MTNIVKSLNLFVVVIVFVAISFNLWNLENITNKKVNSCITGNCHNNLKISKIHKDSLINCFDCHLSTDEKFNTENRHYKLKENISNECNSCHDFQKVEKAQTNNIVFRKHFFDIDTKCLDCHNFHNESNEKLIIQSKIDFKKQNLSLANSSKLCFNCHNIKLLTDSSGINTNFRNQNTNLHFLHSKTKNASNCNSCHDPHSTKNLHLIRDFIKKGNWKNPINYQISNAGGSCNSGCHKTMNYSNMISVSKISSLINDEINAKTIQNIKINSNDIDTLNFEQIKKITENNLKSIDSLFYIRQIYSNMNKSSNLLKLSTSFQKNESVTELSHIVTYSNDLLSLSNQVNLTSNIEINHIIKENIQKFKNLSINNFTIEFINKRGVNLVDLINAIYLTLTSNGVNSDQINIAIKNEISLKTQKDLFLVIIIE